MPQLIDKDAVTDNNWQLVAKQDALPQLDGTKSYLIHATTWLAHQSELSNNPRVGVWLDSDDSPEPLQPYLSSIGVIAINFPVFADGRGYSIARRLRDQLKFSGELRAIGDVLKDQIFFYQRCGFSSFLIREDRSAEDALKAQQDFGVVYQSAADQRTPVLRKR